MLGATKVLGSVSLDTVTENGIYLIAAATDNPFGTNSYAVMEVRMLNNACILQKVYRNNQLPRTRWRWDNSWTSWTLVYDHNLLTNTTELSSLASALGVSEILFDTKVTSVSANSDLNDCTALGKYRCTSNADAATMSNIPNVSAFTMFNMVGIYNNIRRME